MEETWEMIRTAVVLYLPNLLLALGILILGWIAATALSRLVANLLRRTSLDNRIAASVGGTSQSGGIQVERWIATAVFWLVMLFTLLWFFDTLNIPALTGPLGSFIDQIVAFIPGLIGAFVLLLIAWLVATLLRTLIVRVLTASGITNRLSESAEVQVSAQNRTGIAQTIGNVVYWLVFLLFLPAILDALNLQGLLAPVQSLVNEVLAFLPNLLGAILILVIGWLVARVVRQIVTNLLAGLGLDRLGERSGAANALGSIQLSQVVGTIVYVLILIPVAIAALNTLNIPAVSQPAAEMLTNLLNAIPAIFGAFLLLAIAFFVARFVGAFIAGVLSNLGFDRLFRWMGEYVDPSRPTPPPPSVSTPGASAYDLTGSTGAAQNAAQGAGPGETASGAMTPSAFVGYLVTVAILLFAAMEAADMLGFEALTAIISSFIVIAGQVLSGLLVFAIGLYLSYWADRVIRNSGVSQRNILAPAARYAILIFSAALALRQMGIAESIVNLAFGLLLGAVAVAAALAFGLGGRDVAARQLERWQQDIQRIPPAPPTPPAARLSGGPSVPPAAGSPDD